MHICCYHSLGFRLRSSVLGPRLGEVRQESADALGSGDRVRLDRHDGRRAERDHGHHGQVPDGCLRRGARRDHRRRRDRQLGPGGSRDQPDRRGGHDLRRASTRPDHRQLRGSSRSGLALEPVDHGHLHRRGLAGVRGGAAGAVSAVGAEAENEEAAQGNGRSEHQVPLRRRDDEHLAHLPCLPGSALG